MAASGDDSSLTVALGTLVKPRATARGESRGRCGHCGLLVLTNHPRARTADGYVHLSCVNTEMRNSGVARTKSDELASLGAPSFECLLM